jgi:adenine-specific DNA-methyltransferase
MASVSVLYINDDVVGPHLELLRNVCEPASRSRPHITVRYFDRLPMREEYRTTKVAEIDLVEPGSYGLEPSDPAANRTVFIRCKSDDLELIEHRPHFPSGDLHITVYDGKSKHFARDLLRVLRRFKWRFKVPLPDGTTLERIEVKPRRSKRKDVPFRCSPTIERIFQEVTSERLTRDYLDNLSDEQRLKMSRAICNHLHEATANFPKIRGRATKQAKRKRANKSDDQEIHLTPPELACEIAEYAVRQIEPGSPVHFGDPAVGTGAFYSALLQVLPRNQIASAVGIDISPQQVVVATSRWSHRGMKAMSGDYLHMERLRRRTLVLANPPYLRHQEIRPQLKKELRERVSAMMSMRVSARSGLYVYFMLLSHAWMLPEAVAAWLIPSEFMQTAYGEAIRHYLTHKVQLIRVHQFAHDDPQFENALVLPAVVVFRNRPPSSAQTAIMSSGGTLGNPTTTDFVPVEVLCREAKWLIPRPHSSKRFSTDTSIGDIFNVRRGIATGANDFFVIERAMAAQLGIPKRALRPVLPKARAIKGDIVDREEDGYPAVEPQLCLLDYDLSEDEIKTRHPRLMKYLMTARDLGILDRNLVRNRNPWYKQEKREPAPFLCTYMGRGRADMPPIRFIWNKSDAVVTNTYLMLYPRAGLATLLRRQPGLAAKVFALLQETARETMSESWRIHAGGLHKIEPGELLKVRLSTCPAWLVRALNLGLSQRLAAAKLPLHDD